jgi:hypothetical protein
MLWPTSQCRRTAARPASPELVVGSDRVDLRQALTQLALRTGARVARVDSGGRLKVSCEPCSWGALELRSRHPTTLAAAGQLETARSDDHEAERDAGLSGAGTGRTGRRRCRGRQPAGPTCRWIGISGGSKTVAAAARSAAVRTSQTTHPRRGRPAAELTVRGRRRSSGGSTTGRPTATSLVRLPGEQRWAD